MFELQPEKPGLRAYNIISVRVVAGGSAENSYADLLLGSFLGPVLNRATRDVQEELAEAVSLLERTAGCQALDQLGPWIQTKVATTPRDGHWILLNSRREYRGR